jgi:RNA polymerase sigma-54 factor
MRQGLFLKQLQKLSPQQIQLMKLLQVPTARLEDRIKEELEVNPALEMTVEDEFEQKENPLDTPLSEVSDGEESDAEMETDSSVDEEFDMTDFYDESDEGVAEYKTRDYSDFQDPDDENKTIPVASTKTFHEYLEEQLGLMELNEKEYEIGLHLIGSLDDDGYLRRELDAVVDDLAFRQNIDTDEQEILAVLEKVKRLDPPGIGARSLEECLILQLERKLQPTEYTALAIKILRQYFDPFVKKHYDKLERSLGIDSSELKLAIEEITRLNPKPGSAFSGKLRPEQLITPDFIISNNAGDLILSLNAANAPELRVSQSFKDMVTDYKKSKTKDKDTKDALTFIKQKIESAKWFIDAIKQRQNTLLVTMNAIMELQYDYLVSGDETQMKPMILKDIADKTGLDISTISRVASSKYAQTEFGTILLKFFFSESLSTDSGEEVSTREVKKILSDMIDNEDKTTPISDQDLTDQLSKLGYNIARRTVAKYREQMNISVARLRKEL